MMLQLRDNLFVISQQHVVTHIPKKGLKKFGMEGRSAKKGELQQLHNFQCFKTVGYNSLSETECKRVVESLFSNREKRWKNQSKVLCK